MTLAPAACAKLAMQGTILLTSNDCTTKVVATPVCQPGLAPSDGGSPQTDATLPDASANPDAGLDATLDGEPGQADGATIDAGV